MRNYVAGVLIREMETIEAARISAEKMSKCPKCLAIGTDGKKLIGVYMMLPEDSWSLDFPEIFPETRSTMIQIPDLYYPESLEVDPVKTPPCGENCELCDLRTRYNCRGCLATRLEEDKET